MLIDMSENTAILSSLGHDLIVRRVWVSPFYSLINCCRAQGRSREVLAEVASSKQLEDILHQFNYEG